MRKQHLLPKNESGLVSLVITIIMVFILTLIVLTFARISRREQRQALDRQLNTQAFYAAEVGINDAIDAIKKAAPTDPIVNLDKTDCDDPLPGPAYTNPIDAEGLISYSCILIDPTPPSLDYDIDKGTSKVTSIQRKANPPIAVGTLDVYWAGDGREFTGCPGPNETNEVFRPSWYDNCGAGILRIDLVPVPPTGLFSRNNLISNTMTIFAVPQSSGGVTNVLYSSAAGFGRQGAVIGVRRCIVGPTDSKCRLEIRGLTGLRYFMRIMSLYKPASVTLCSPSCTTNPSELVGAQAVIDSTGKANDVLRRIQARVCINSSFCDDGSSSFPNYALESSETICKRFAMAPPSTLTAGNPDQACEVPAN